MIEISLIYRRLKDGTEYLEHVCSSRDEATAELAYLKEREIIVPAINDDAWINLGLNIRQQEYIVGILADCGKSTNFLT